MSSQRMAPAEKAATWVTVGLLIRSRALDPGRVHSVLSGLAIGHRPLIPRNPQSVNCKERAYDDVS